MILYSLEVTKRLLMRKSDKIQKRFLESVAFNQQCIEHSLQPLTKMGDKIIESIKNNKKLMLCGNGDSVVVSQHLTTEMLVRLRPNIKREGISAIALA
jgi:D-sedoheptulose 7-phosphate isomerase